MIWTKNILSKFVSGERNQQILLSMITAFIVKGGALIVSLLSMPAYIKYFDNQVVLGLWFTVLSVMTWILSFDLGIGNGLRNKLVGAIVNNDKDTIKKYISSAYIINGALAGVTLILGFIVFPFVNWNVVFNISDSIISKRTMLFAVQIIFLGMMVQFYLRLISSILYALQKSAIPNLLSLITSVSQLILILLLPSSDAGTNLKMLSFIYILCVNVPLMITSIIVFRTYLRNCAPNIKYFRRELAVDVMKLGGLFFWCQIMYMIIVTTNDYCIAQFAGAKYVVDYQIYNRLFTLVGMLFTLALTPIWSAITKALNERDVKWLKKIYRLLNLIVLFVVICEFAIIPLLQNIVNLWIGKHSIDINVGYAITFALYGSVFIYQSVLSTFACGFGKLKLQAICYSIGALCKFAIINFGVMVYDHWVVVIVANLIVLVPYIILQPIFLNREFNAMKLGGLENV